MSSIEPACRVEVPMADGARVVAFVYAPKGVRDEPGTPFAVAGEPAPVLVLHGNGEDHGHMLGLIERLRGERSVIAMDTRGHGSSARGASPLSYELVAADALEVLSRLGVTQAHVLGFSDGGIVGLLLARDAPHRVLSLTALGANLTPEGLSREARRGMRVALAGMGAVAAVAGGVMTGPRARYGEAELLRLMLEQPHIPADSLARISCPTCVMAGEHDLILAEETTRIAAAISGARLVTVPGAGHDLPLEAPYRVACEARETMAAGEPAHRSHPLVTFGANGPEAIEPTGGIVVVSATAAEEPGVLALYERVLDACDEPGRETCGWRRGFWPLPDDVGRRLRAGTTWIAVAAADASGGAAKPRARVLGAMSLDGDFGLDGLEPAWEPLGSGEALTCHLLATDPEMRGRGVASALLAAYAREGLARGCKALRINTSPQSLSNRLYRELGFTRWPALWFPYEGLPLTPWTNPYELRLNEAAR